MAELVADCPRCNAKKITFDVSQANIVGTSYQWQYHYEVFATCRHCGRSTIFNLSDDSEADFKRTHATGLLKMQGSLNSYIAVKGFVSLKDADPVASPDHVPGEVEAIFHEGARCLAVNCFNAAGTMFRLCVDVVTRGLLPAPEVETPGLNAKVRRDLGLRLPWLFDNGVLPEALRELSACIKEDGNDGAHAGTLKKEDAEDLLDFTTVLLERIYTEPEQVRLAKERREVRRAEAKGK